MGHERTVVLVALRERWSIVSLAEAVTSMIFVETSLLSPQTRVCRDKIIIIINNSYKALFFNQS